MDFSEISQKRQKRWKESKLYKADQNKDKSKCYILDMFPYPSGAGLHVGHPKGYVASDTIARKKMLEGYNVLHPMGFDTFGLGTEQYAIEHKMKPQVVAQKNIETYIKQLEKIGFTYDWERSFSTADPEYFKRTQSIFLKFYNHYYDEVEQKAKPISDLEKKLRKEGKSDSEIKNSLDSERLAYLDYKPIKWCPHCKTGLSNEDLDDGKCERCGSEVEQRPMRQRILRITKYAQRLLDGLDDLERDESMKELERNWIGKSEGSQFKMRVKMPENKAENIGECQEVPENESENAGEGNKVGEKFIDGTYEIIGCAMEVHKQLGPGLQEKIYHAALLKQLTKKGFKVESEKNVSYKVDNEIIGYGKVDLVVNDTIALELKSRKIIEGDFYKQLRAYINHSNTIQTGLLLNFYNGKLEYKRLEKDYISKNQATTHTATMLNKPEENTNSQDILGNSQNHSQEFFEVYTTRLDTVFGMSFVVMAPEHPLVEKITTPEQLETVRAYQEQAKHKTQLERTELQKEKTGVFTGAYAINPFNNEEVPIYIGDYVLANYGTGVVMAVPAHDERDFEFAKKYGISIKQSILPKNLDIKKQENTLKIIDEIFSLTQDYGIDVFLSSGWGISFCTGVIYRGHSDVDFVIKQIHIDKLTEVLKKNGFQFIGTNESLYGNSMSSYVFVKNDIRIEINEEIKLSVNGVFDEESKKTAQKELWGHLGQTQSEEYLLKLKEYLLGNRKNNDDRLDIEMLTVGAFTEKGIVVNSGEFSGLTSDEAIAKMQIWLEEKGLGGKKTNFKIQDWVFSRQRYWGEPFPVVFCEEHGVVPLQESDLPLLLPDVENYEPTGTEEGPLAEVKERIETTCPICGKPAKRESNTMPGWAGSSRYWLRYMDPKNSNQLVDPEMEKYWQNVDIYVGGAEHVTRHIIYARFWQKFLFDLGLVSKDEPFQKYQKVGLIMAEDGRKMSKRRGNVVNPDDVIAEYGADVFRTYEMFMGPFDQAVSWNTNGVKGIKKFLDKICGLYDKIDDSHIDDKDAIILLNQTIKKVGEDIDTFGFNTAISQMMILVNALTKQDKISKKLFEKLIIILSPFAPHMAEEFWERLGNNYSIFNQGSWPKYDENFLMNDSITIGVQVNGKVRGTIDITMDMSQEEVMDIIRNNEKIARNLTGGIKKVIYIPGKICNIVV